MPRDALPDEIIVLSTPGDRSEAIARALSTGPAVVRCVAPDDAPSASSGLLVLDAGSLPDQALDGILDRVEAISPAHLLIALRFAQLDSVAARLLALGVEMLCDASEDAIVAAAWSAQPSSVAARGRSVREPGSPYQAEDGVPDPAAAAALRAVIRARRMRARFFADDLFADPAWDMLLDLQAACFEDRRVSVTSLCIAAAVPPTTALRWIGTLHERGLIERRADPADRRRAHIALSATGRRAMQDYLEAVRRAGLNPA